MVRDNQGSNSWGSMMDGTVSTDQPAMDCPTSISSAKTNTSYALVARTKSKMLPQADVAKSKPSTLIKLVGRKSNSTKLHSARDIHKKFIFHMDNVVKSVTVDDVETYLEENNVKVLSCFVANSWMRAEEKDNVASFRVCVNLDDRLTVMDNTFWPEYIIIREWRFKTKTPAV